MKNILILVPTKFEDTELTAVADVFDRENITYDFVSIDNNDSEPGSHFVTVKTIPIKNIDVNNYHGLFLPGGAGAEEYLKNENVCNIIKEYASSGKLMSAICAAPDTFLKLKLLGNIKYTAHPGYADGPNKVDKDVVVDRNFVTGKDFMASQKLGLTITEEIKKYS